MKKKVFISILLVLAIAFSIAPVTMAVSTTTYETEPNNSLSTADRTYNDYINYGTINPAGDEDWWVVSFSNSGSGSFWLGYIPSGHDFDLRVYNSSGNLIAKSINNGNAQEYICVDVVANSNYYVKVYGNGTGSSSQYQMKAKLYSWTDVYTPLYEQQYGNTCGAANMRMVLAKYGVYLSEESIRLKANALGGYDGAYKSPGVIATVLNWYLSNNSISTSYTYHYVSNMSDATYWSKITANINNGKPLIAMLAYDDYHYFPSTSEGHYVTIRSYCPNSQIHQVRINDSTPGTYCRRGIPLSDLNYYTNYPSGNCYIILNQW